jgi:hypothetical protein
MSVPCRIAFGHKARVGKDRSASYLAATKNAHIVRISKPVYEIVDIIKKGLLKTTFMRGLDKPSSEFNEPTALEYLDIVDDIKGHLKLKLDPEVYEKYIHSKNDLVDSKLLYFIRTVLYMVGGVEIANQINDPNGKWTYLLQKVGEGFKGIFYEEIWDDIAERESIIPIIAVDNNANIAIPDLRFHSNINMLKKYGFKFVKINREDRVIDRDPKNRSEIDLDDYKDWDEVIENNTSIDELHFKLVQFLHKEGW